MLYHNLSTILNTHLLNMKNSARRIPQTLISFNLSVVVGVLNVLVFANGAKSRTELFIHFKFECFKEKNGKFLHFNILRLEEEKYWTERVITGLCLEILQSGSSTSIFS